VSYFTLRWLSKKCNFEPRASVSSVDGGQRPSHRPRCESPVSMIVAVSTKPNRQNRSTCSRNNARINDLDGRTTKALNGVSMAFAIAGTPWLLPTERFAVSMDWGTFQGTNALALNAALRLGTGAISLRSSSHFAARLYS